MNKHPMSVPSSVTAPSTDRDLGHHPFDRRSVVDVPGPVAITVAPTQAPDPELPAPDLRVMVTMLNDAMCQVSLLRNEVSDLRRKLERAADCDPLPSAPPTGTIRVSVRTGFAPAQVGVEATSSEREDSIERTNSFDWDAWQRDTKARIRRAMANQALGPGMIGAGAE